MSAWAVDAGRRRAFFGDGSDDERASRRSRRGSRAELVVDESDDATHDDKPTKAARDDTATGKLDELLTPELTAQSVRDKSTGLASQYAHWLVQDFLQRKYPPYVVTTFLKENPPPATAAEKRDGMQTLHSQVIGPIDPTSNPSVPPLEQVLGAWDERTHHRTLRTRRRDSNTSDQDTAMPTHKTKSRSSSVGSRKKPQLSVTVTEDSSVAFREETPREGGEYNRLNHPGHTPKAQDVLLAAVLGEPGSTPKASLTELKALGFDDMDDNPPVEPLIPTPKKAEIVDDSDDDELSRYARRKRAAQRHDKHVFVGEQGRTPTKEYVFFRETPPRFVTETIEAAEQVLRSIGGNPEVKRLQVNKTERFVELQSSDVAKYSVGQRVEKLGAQRNVSGQVSKLYGSRQCGTAGPGTVVIDTWNGSDTAPATDEEEE